MMDKENYTKMMDEIHVSEDVLRKVRDMNMSTSNKKKSFLKTIGSIAAAAAFVFIASNGICYAATGETLVGKAIVYINGEKSTEELVFVDDGNGNYSAEFSTELDVTEGEEQSVVVATGVEKDEDGNLVPVELTPEEMDEKDGILLSEVVEKDGRQYLKYAEGEIDVTDDLSDGKAEGDIRLETGELYHYMIISGDDGYEVSFSYEK